MLCSRQKSASNNNTWPLTSSMLEAQIGKPPNISKSNDLSSHGEDELHVVRPFASRLDTLLRNPFTGPSVCFFSHGHSVCWIHNLINIRRIFLSAPGCHMRKGSVRLKFFICTSCTGFITLELHDAFMPWKMTEGPTAYSYCTRLKWWTLTLASAEDDGSW